jgi:N-glycosylase/DNA lyase
MKYYQRDCMVEITDVSDFDLERIFECGQCFRWNVDKNGAYTGVAFGIAARIYRDGNSIFISGTIDEFESVWLDYFDLNRDYSEIRRGLCVDDFMQEATTQGAGIRILRQEKWEALCSFIISQCNNIPRIKSIISTICKEFGNAIELDGQTYYSFPSAQTIALLDADKLAPARCGYRAEYIITAAKAVASGKLDLDYISIGSPDVARAELKKLHGVGDKVADCVLLFGLNMLDAFPVDVWIKRAMDEHFEKGFDYRIFSPYAGVAQQYIFHYVRNVKATL